MVLVDNNLTTLKKYVNGMTKVIKQAIKRPSVFYLMGIVLVLIQIFICLVMLPFGSLKTPSFTQEYVLTLSIGADRLFNPFSLWKDSEEF